MVVGEDECQLILEVFLFGEWVLWCFGCVLVIGNFECCWELFEGLVVFVWYEGYLCCLEGEIVVVWELVQVDVELIQLLCCVVLWCQEYVNWQV